MFSHVTLGSNDLERTKRFYDATLGALGASPGRFDDKGRLQYRHAGALLLIVRPLDGAPATGANGGTLGFLAESPEQTDKAHAAGTAAGGTTCEDPPGPRGDSGLYLAYLRDPDGNKLCLLHRAAA